MTNARVSAARRALIPAINNRDGKTTVKILADLAKTDPEATKQICDELIEQGLNNIVNGTPAAGS